MFRIILHQNWLIAAATICALSLTFLPIKSQSQTRNNGAWIIDPRDKRIALVIGNDHYHGNLGDLDNAINDAKAIHEKLSHMGYSVTFIDDGDNAEMQRAMKRFASDARAAKVALFFYAGHGLQILSKDKRALTNQLLPVDYALVTDNSYETSVSKMIDLASFLSKLENSGAETRIVILDACRNIPGRAPERITDSEEEHKGEDANLDKLDDQRAIRKLLHKPKLRSIRLYDGGFARTGFSEMVHKLGTLIVYSAATGQIASDGIGSARNSPFTTALLKYIDNPDQKIDDILINVKKEVNRLTSKSGSPQSLSIFNNLDRNFFPVARLQRTEFYKQMQMHLKSRGCYAGSIDGKWGKRSSVGLDQFKEMSSLSIETENIDMATLNAIRNYLATTLTIEFCQPSAPSRNTAGQTKKVAIGTKVTTGLDKCFSRAQRWCSNPANSSDIGYQACVVQAKAGCRNQ